MNRRAFVALVAAAGAAIGGGVAWLLGRRWGEPAAADVPLAPDGRPVFPESYRKNLRAVCARLVPEEPGAVGADGTAAYDFIEKEMTREEMQPGRRLLMRGSVQLDRVARQEVGSVFWSASAEDQDRVIGAMIGGAGANELFKPSDFIEMMMALTLEGMLGDPAHGGNRGEGGWQLVGWAMHPPRPCIGEHVCE